MVRILVRLMGCVLLLTGGCVVDTVGFVEGEVVTPDNPRPGNNDNNDNNDLCSCNPITQECCSGICVDVGTCGDLPDCEAVGDPCEIPQNSPATRQGDFLCARLEGTSTNGTCLRLCDTDFSISGCDEGTFCLSVNAIVTYNVCLPGECETTGQCNAVGPYGGNCIQFGNNAGFCFQAGDAELGDPCNPTGGSAFEVCGPDLWCASRPEDVMGVCQPLCNMWSNQTVCPANTACGFLTVGQGVCREATDRGGRVFEECDPEFNWCDTGVECLDFETGGESLPVCTAYCRPGNPTDCTGPDFQGRPANCATVFSDGNGDLIEDIGLCL